MDLNFNRIFVVGFPKCGTSSLQASFSRLGIYSVHWADTVPPVPTDTDWQEKQVNIINENSLNLVAFNIEKAKKESLQLLSYLDKYRAFTQMDACFYECCYWPQLLDVPTLDEQYPTSKFIFNDRDIQKWIKSVTHWVDYGQNLRDKLIKFDIPGLPKGKGKEDKELKNWYLWHKNNMIDYFKNKDNFIVFDIEKDKPKKLGDFLGVKDFILPHLNKS